MGTRGSSETCARSVRPAEMCVRAVILAALCLPLAGIEGHAQTIRGHVVDDDTSEPLVGVQLNLQQVGSERVMGAVSDSAGAFTFRVPEGGRFLLSASRIGYMPVDSLEVEAEARQTVDVVVRLSPTAIAVDPIEVTVHQGVEVRHLATYEGFLHRKERAPPVGSVRAVTKDDPEMRSAILVSDVLQWFSPVRGCVRVFLDGSPLRRGLREVSVANLEGIEFYRHATDAPLEYRDGHPCSVIGLWSPQAVPR